MIDPKKKEVVQDTEQDVVFDEDYNFVKDYTKKIVEMIKRISNSQDDLLKKDINANFNDRLRIIEETCTKSLAAIEKGNNVVTANQKEMTELKKLNASLNTQIETEKKINSRVMEEKSALSLTISELQKEVKGLKEMVSYVISEEAQEKLKKLMSLLK